MAIGDRLKRMWNAFTSTPDTFQMGGYPGTVSGLSTRSPDRARLHYTNERSIISSIYTRLAIDVAAIDVRHVEIDKRNRYSGDSTSKFNLCLTLEPNVDQGPRAFRQDLAMTLFDKGVACIVPVDSIGDPNEEDSFDILSLRVGEIVGWYPYHVRVSLYNEQKGVRQDITLSKRFVAIIENPLYAVMNEPNSTLQRLIRKLNLLDTVDEQSGSGKLDLIIQLPYVIKSEARRQQAQQRRDEIEVQLKGSQYGIAYADGTEKITQLNRPAENNLLKQVEYLTNMLYGQLGLTEEVMNGTADEKSMLNYFNRTIEPVVAAEVEGMNRTLVGRTAWQSGKRVKYFNNPFKLVPLNDIAEIADKLTRNEIMTANEFRDIIGLPPSDDPKADKLINSNMPQPTEGTGTQSLERDSQNGS